MTNVLRQPRRSATRQLPTPPSGWPIGSYPTYAKAQQAVEYLSAAQFPVQDVTIVGVDLVQVERVLGGLNWQKVIRGGVASGAWLGVFVGLVLGLFTGGFLAPLMLGVTMGIVFGVICTALPYAAAKRKRDFSTTMQLVAGRYDVLCDPTTAERAREKLSHLPIV